MTESDPAPEPDPVTALAAQLEELRRQLAVYTGETGALRARLDRDAGQVLMFRLQVKQLTAKLAEATAARQAADPPAPFWLGLGEEEHAARLAEVRGWVEHVARVQWPGYMTRLPPCWANHPEAVWELSNLMTEWSRIYGDSDSRPLQDALCSSSAGFPACCPVSAAAVRCDAAGCQQAARHPAQRSPPAPPQTDRPEGPGMRLRAGAFGMPRLPSRQSSISGSASSDGLRLAGSPARRQAARRAPGTAQPGDRAPPPR